MSRSPGSSSFVTLLIALASLPLASARADDEDAANRAKMIDRLLNTKVADGPSTWAVFEEGHCSHCAHIGYGGCALVEGAPDCSVTIVDQFKKKKPETVVVVRGADKPAALAKGRAELDKLLEKLGKNPLWFEEHLFARPAVDVTLENVVFRWDWKAGVLTILDGKKPFKTLKGPKLRKGLTATSVAIWYHHSAKGTPSVALLRVHGEGNEGERQDAVSLVSFPPIRT